MSRIKRILIAALTLACMTACGKTETSTVSTDSKTHPTGITVTTQAETVEITKATTANIITEITTASEQSMDITDENISASDYKTAYKKVIEDNGFDKEESVAFGLIYFNADDIPELSVRVPFKISLFTYSDGEVHTIMDNWMFGAMGLNGYEYLPECNSVYFEDGDYAGAIRYHTYLSLDENFEFYVTDQYESHLFNDVNGNGVPDSNDEILDTPVYYYNDMKVTENEIAELKKGEYESISNNLTLDELYLLFE